LRHTVAIFENLIIEALIEFEFQPVLNICYNERQLFFFKNNFFDISIQRLRKHFWHGNKNITGGDWEGISLKVKVLLFLFQNTWANFVKLLRDWRWQRSQIMDWWCNVGVLRVYLCRAPTRFFPASSAETGPWSLSLLLLSFFSLQTHFSRNFVNKPMNWSSKNSDSASGRYSESYWAFF